MKIIAHRGNKRYTPENTMAAFYSASSYLVDGIELDLQFTKDEVPVVIHDSKIDRTTNGRGYVSSFTFNELRQFDAGSWFHEIFRGEKIPSFEEVLNWATDKQITLHVELKKQKTLHHAFVDKCMGLIDNSELGDNIVISSFYPPYLSYIKEKHQSIKTALLTKSPFFRAKEYLSKVGADAIHIRHSYYGARFYRKWSTSGIPIRTYHIQSIKEALKCHKLRVDSIITNDPRKMIEIFHNVKTTS
ncbi:glycerophosphodiester phosphodiesterase [Litchfieldia alkalitelluris]|uniref:Glycerophosphodiester phosphodiesterase n=2 Tax=Evansella alkalicola TaxID=745819 RepID=A0ABS6JVR6_9BACI|nr:MULTISPECIES: glycerophosphodiester phosphodiesterase family protein [Bacillaceae]MBU9722485.1 glycerophosphodiester phosphodiesterase [Bacillus alkalicola]